MGQGLCVETNSVLSFPGSSCGTACPIVHNTELSLIGGRGFMSREPKAKSESTITACSCPCAGQQMQIFAQGICVCCCCSAHFALIANLNLRNLPSQHRFEQYCQEVGVEGMSPCSRAVSFLHRPRYSGVFFKISRNFALLSTRSSGSKHGVSFEDMVEKARRELSANSNDVLSREVEHPEAAAFSSNNAPWQHACTVY